MIRPMCFFIAGLNGSIAIGRGLAGDHGSSGWHLFLFLFLMFAATYVRKVRRAR
jgi:hypothetical protein